MFYFASAYLFEFTCSNKTYSYAYMQLTPTHILWHCFPFLFLSRMIYPGSSLYFPLPGFLYSHSSLICCVFLFSTFFFGIFSPSLLSLSLSLLLWQLHFATSSFLLVKILFHLCHKIKNIYISYFLTTHLPLFARYDSFGFSHPSLRTEHWGCGQRSYRWYFLWWCLDSQRANGVWRTLRGRYGLDSTESSRSSECIWLGNEAASACRGGCGKIFLPAALLHRKHLCWSSCTQHYMCKRLAEYVLPQWPTPNPVNPLWILSWRLSYRPIIFCTARPRSCKLPFDSWRVCMAGACVAGLFSQIRLSRGAERWLRWAFGSLSRDSLQKRRVCARVEQSHGENWL